MGNSCRGQNNVRDGSNIRTVKTPVGTFTTYHGGRGNGKIFTFIIFIIIIFIITSSIFAMKGQNMGCH